MTQTFSQVAALWKADKRQWVKDATYAVYLQHLNNHILPYFSGVGSIDEACIQAFVNEKTAEGKSPKSIRDIMLVLRMLLQYGAKLGAWPPVAFNVHYPAGKDTRKAVEVLSRTQQKTLLEYLRGHFSFRNLGILICLQSGLRIGEVTGLQWKDLDLEAGVIRVGKTVQRIYLADGEDKRYFLSIGTPKTRTSIRDIPISRELMQTVRPLRKVMDPEFYVVSNGERPIEPRTYRDYYSRLLRQLSIPPVRFHALRHSFATRCIESKCDYKTVSVILGHASISTTLDLYVHPGYEEKKKAIEQMAKGMG